MIERGYGASLTGTMHIKNNMPNQDNFLVDNYHAYTLVVVCDGLGSKKHSRYGSRKLCKVIKREVRTGYKKNNLNPVDLINNVQRKWKRNVFPFKASDCSSTCLFALISNMSILMCQLGDGMIAFKQNDETKVISVKDDDFVNETKSIHRSTLKDWTIEIIEKRNNTKYNLILCSDGISEDIKIDFLSEFISELELVISNNKDKHKNDSGLLNLLENWPNVYSSDDKTLVVVK